MKKIAVIGAGPMGLAVAYQLTIDGYEPVLFEADDRVGGMAAVFDFDGIDIERYYHFHCISDEDFLKMLDELNLSEKMKWTETKMSYWYNNRVQRWGNPIALLLFKGLSLIAKIRYGLFALIATKRNTWENLDKLESSSWITKWVGNEAWDLMWKQLYDLKFYQYSKNLSAAWIWSRIKRIGRSRYNLMREKLGYLEGGSKTLLKGMADSVKKNGGKIILNSRIEKVEIENGAVTGVIGPKGFEAFDVVISTIALPYVVKIMPDLPDDVLKKFKEKKNIAVVCVIVKLKTPLTDNFWLNITDKNIDYPGIIEYSNLNPMVGNIVYVPYYMPNDHPGFKQSDKEFINKVKSGFKTINSDLTEDDFLAFSVNRCRYAQPICEPEYLKTLPPIDLPIKGLYAADTSYYYPEDRGISESIGIGRKMAKMVIK